MSTDHYDLIVIGSGPAGEKGAAQAAYFGKRVAVIERERVPGGAAANTGTLPSKTLRETALYLSGFRQRGLYGVDVSLKDRVTARDFLYREQVVKETERNRILENLARHKVDLLTGVASFVDPHTIAIQDYNGQETRLTADVFLIATGSSPLHPKEYPFEDDRVHDSNSILDLVDIPKTMIVVGGGVIGCEYACMFAALGIQVSLIDGRGRLLGFMDTEISQQLQTQMQLMGITLHMPETVKAVHTGTQLEIELVSGACLGAETLLVASGRSANTRGLRLEELGVVMDARGTIKVNDKYQTALPHIYAAGDVIGFPALAATSMEQARVAMVHAFDLKYKTELCQVLPYGIYTIPECSMAGETEESLKEKGTPYIAGRARYAVNARGQIIGESKTAFLKLLFEAETMKLVGVHMIGEQASEVVHIGLTALLVEAGADLFIRTCFNYPTLSELYKYATYDALGARERYLAERANPGEHPESP